MELVKETFPKLKSLPESDRGANVDGATLANATRIPQIQFAIATLFYSIKWCISMTLTEALCIMVRAHPGRTISSQQGEFKMPSLLEIFKLPCKSFRKCNNSQQNVSLHFHLLFLHCPLQQYDIQYNIEASAAATSQAKLQLSKVSKRGKSKASWCWWVLAIVVVVLVILLFVPIL